MNANATLLNSSLKSLHGYSANCTMHIASEQWTSSMRVIFLTPTPREFFLNSPDLPINRVYKLKGTRLSCWSIGSSLWLPRGRSKTRNSCIGLCLQLLRLRKIDSRIHQHSIRGWSTSLCTRWEITLSDSFLYRLFLDKVLHKRKEKMQKKMKMT